MTADPFWLRSSAVGRGWEQPEQLSEPFWLRSSAVGRGWEQPER